MNYFHPVANCVWMCCSVSVRVVESWVGLVLGLGFCWCWCTGFRVRVGVRVSVRVRVLLVLEW